MIVFHHFTDARRPVIIKPPIPTRLYPFAAVRDIDEHLLLHEYRRRVMREHLAVFIKYPAFLDEREYRVSLSSHCSSHLRPSISFPDSADNIRGSNPGVSAVLCHRTASPLVRFADARSRGSSVCTIGTYVFIYSLKYRRCSSQYLYRLPINRLSVTFVQPLYLQSTSMIACVSASDSWIRFRDLILP